MSMIARFVQVTPVRMRQLLDDPDTVESLFDDEPATPLASAAMNNAAQERLLRQGPQMLAATLAGMNRETRESLSKRLESLGIDVGSFAAGSGGDAIAKLMEQRMRAMSQPPATR